MGHLLCNESTKRAEDVQVYTDNGEVILIEYLFPRRDAITIDDKDVEFITKVGEIEIKKKFKLEDMVFGDRLIL